MITIPEPKYTVTRDEDHIYTISPMGLVVPGTTGILDTVGSKKKTDMLMGWAKKQCLLKVAEHIRTFANKALTVDEAWIETVRKSAWKRDRDIFKEAGDTGNKIHKAIDAYIIGGPPILDDQSRPGFENFLAWIKTSGIKLIKGDTYVASIKYKFGGALDALGEQDGKLVLLDWKTASAMRDTYPLQVAAYSMAFKEMYGLKVKAAYVVRFGKEIPGDVEPKEIILKPAWTAFKHAIKLTELMNNNMWAEPVKAAL